MKKILAMTLLTTSLLFSNDNSIGVDTLIGATLGVAVGNQIGSGNGRDVAKVVGGILGASIANSSRDNYNNDYNRNYYETGDSYTVYSNGNGYYNKRPVINNYYVNQYDDYYQRPTQVIYYSRPQPVYYPVPYYKPVNYYDKNGYYHRDDRYNHHHNTDRNHR